MFLDWSGSMANHIDNTVKQLFALVMFCKKVNIPFEVYTFVDGDIIDEIGGRSNKTVLKRGDIICREFKLVNILSSKMSAVEFSKAGAIMTFLGKHPRYAPKWMYMHGTPLNEAIISAFNIIPEFKSYYKLQIVNTVFLTDGAGHSLNRMWDWNPEKDIEEEVYIDSSTITVFVDPEIGRAHV